MDHEKPEAVVPQGIDYYPTEQARSPVTPDIEYAGPPSINEAEDVEDRKDPRGDSVWRTLGERHINVRRGKTPLTGLRADHHRGKDDCIFWNDWKWFASSPQRIYPQLTIPGLFLGCGTSLAVAGPGGAVLSYIIMGTVISSVISCLCEMTALMPVNAPMMEFPRRFLDRGVGFAVGWMYWFAYAILAADELVAVSNTVKFQYNDGTTYLNWAIGENVDNAVWISLFLIIVISINMFPVKVFGELEYIFGTIKLTFISMLIVLMLVLDVMKPRANAYYTEPIGSKYWNSPFSFFNSVYRVENEAGDFQRAIKGTVGTLLAMWTTIVHVIFSYVGMDIIAATAAESRALSDAESMKMGGRKINLRIVTLYAMAMLMVSFVVPSDHPFINGGGQSVGSHSPFIIAVVEAGLPTVAHFFNAMFVFASFTCAINSMYVASRVLHTLALQDQTGPEFITSRLRSCRSGVPVRAVLVTAAMMMVGFMGRTGAPGERLSELASNCTVSCLIVYIAICATYLSFFRTLDDAKTWGNSTEAHKAMYDRNHPKYPYKSHGQWLKACYGMVACIILVIFNGIGPFLEDPFDMRRFIASYIGIPVFILLILGYKIRKHGLHISKWGPERSDDLRNTIQASSEKRKGRLEFPDDGFTKENGRTLVDWIWVWMK